MLVGEPPLKWLPRYGNSPGYRNRINPPRTALALVQFVPIVTPTFACRPLTSALHAAKRFARHVTCILALRPGGRDLPSHEHVPDHPQGFALHMRGSTGLSSALSSPQNVCPAYAGIYRRRRPRQALDHGLPCICGDLPRPTAGSPSDARFALHTRGSTIADTCHVAVRKVCPAYAGIYRQPRLYLLQALCLPCIRGDLPYSILDQKPDMVVCPA